MKEDYTMTAMIRRIVLAFCCSLLLIGAPPAPAGCMTLLGVGAPCGVAGSGGTPFALDGAPDTGTGTAASFPTNGVTTTYASVWYIAIETNGGPVTAGGVTSAHLTWTRRTQANTLSGAGQYLELWSAVASGPLTGEIVTVTTTGSSFFAYALFAFSGAHNASPYDANGPAQSSSNAAYAGFTTANANDIIIAAVATAGGASTNDPSWTAINNTNFLNVEYRAVGSTQPTNIAPGAVPSNGGGSVVDAIIQGP